MGLGNFHRAHEAWYTARSEDAADWGIAAFTGRSPQAANTLSSQDGLYTLIERGPDHDRAEIIGSLSRAIDGADVRALAALVAAAEVSILSLTVTEAGYHLGPDGAGSLTDPLIDSDLRQWREWSGGRQATPRLQTPLARILFGLESRRRAHGRPIAIVPCDNLSGNGEVVAGLLKALASEVEAALAAWIANNVSCVSTSVDRITPRTTEADLRVAEELTGWYDACPVVTEPFADWTMSGDFPGGRPRWESAGARLVTDVTPFEQRKLWLLNGAHSTLAYLGLVHGHTTVAEAMADPACRAAVDGLWKEAVRHLPAGLDLGAYESALLARLSNLRLAHPLRQIGMEGVAKLRVRVVPVAEAELASGGGADGCARAIAAWIVAARRRLLPEDACGADVAAAAARPGTEGVRDLIALLSAGLAREPRFVDRVAGAVQAISDSNWAEGAKP